MKKLEYSIEDAENANFSYTHVDDDMKYLNGKVKEGWELVSAMLLTPIRKASDGAEIAKVRYIFKREI